MHAAIRSLSKFADRLVPPVALEWPVEDRRQARLMIYLTACGMFAAIAAGALTAVFGYPWTGAGILVGAALIPTTMIVFRLSGSVEWSCHYLAGLLFVLAVSLAEDPVVGCIALIAIPVGTALIGGRGWIVWAAVVVGWDLWIGWAARDSFALAAPIASVSALVAVVAGLTVWVSESARQQSRLRADRMSAREESQVALIRHLVDEYFDAVVSMSGIHIRHASEGIVGLLGYEPQSVSGELLAGYIHPEDVHKLSDLDRSGAPPLRAELRFRHTRGHWLWCEVYLVPAGGFGSENSAYMVMRDFMRERLMRDQLIEAQRLEGMGSLAAGIAHDFNNMLTIILGFAELLEPGKPRDEISGAAERAAALAARLLSFGRSRPRSTEVHDLSELVKTQVDLVRHSLDSRFVLIENYVGHPVLVRVDEHQFAQVVINLVNNAREAMPGGGDLEISLRTVDMEKSDQNPALSGPYAVLEVRDSGHGMDELTQSRVFEPFFTTRESSRNPGLGLPTCHGVVAQYRGFLDIDSSAGEGASVSVYLPLAEISGDQPVVEWASGGISVLVVDDDADVLEVTRIALTNAGFSVDAFADGADAIAQFRGGHYKLVVADVVMSGISGPDLVARLRYTQPDLPALFVSGFTHDFDAEWEDDGRVHGFLAKPFRSVEIVSRVRALVALGDARAAEQRPIQTSDAAPGSGESSGGGT